MGQALLQKLTAINISVLGGEGKEKAEGLIQPQTGHIMALGPVTYKMDTVHGYPKYTGYMLVTLKEGNGISVADKHGQTEPLMKEGGPKENKPDMEFKHGQMVRLIVDSG